MVCPRWISVLHKFTCWGEVAIFHNGSPFFRLSLSFKSANKQALNDLSICGFCPKQITALRGGVKNCFFYFWSKRGGGLGQSKKSFRIRKYSDIFYQRGGGLTQSKSVLSDFLAQFAKNGGFI